MSSLKISKPVAGHDMRIGSGFTAKHLPEDAFQGLIDPVVMVDHFHMTSPTFQPHPHAGISAVTYMFEDSTSPHVNYDSMGNNGPIQPQGSTKAAQFIQLCDQSGTPLVFLQNTTGYMVGSAAEHGGAIKHGSKMIQAVANARVPKFTIVLNGSFGAGNYGMCGRGFDPRFIFSWPSARVAVMGGAQAAKVMEIVTRGKMERAGMPVNDAMLEGMSAEIKKRLDAESNVLFGTALVVWLAGSLKEDHGYSATSAWSWAIVMSAATLATSLPPPEPTRNGPSGIRVELMLPNLSTCAPPRQAMVRVPAPPTSAPWSSFPPTTSATTC